MNLNHIKTYYERLKKNIPTENDIFKFNQKFKPAIARGNEVSRLAMNDEIEVHLTPYAKAILEQLEARNNLPQQNDSRRLLASEGVTALDEFLEATTNEILTEFVGPELLDYPDDFESFDNYRVDCWRNFKRGTEWRHIKPNMNKDRIKAFNQFGKPFNHESFDIRPLIKHESQLASLELLDKMIPTVSSSKEWVEINSLFKTKHTNVGFPYFRNDRAKAPNGMTYGDLVDKEARKLKPKDVVLYPFIAFGRNQRQKARPILGGSRIQALVYNQLESQEISTYKTDSLLFKGYLDRTGLRESLINMYEFAKRNNLTLMNRDYSKFDTTVKPNLKLLIGAFNIEKTLDSYGKEIAYWRTLSTINSSLVNGLLPNDKLWMFIYGRIFSGEIDTNAGGGKINAFVTMSAMMSIEPKWKELCYNAIKEQVPPLLVMGDDNLIIQPKSINNKDMTKVVKELYNMDVSDSKGESGCFFLQNRICKSRDSDKILMITPFTRIIRSIMNKERPVGLGPAGWTIATIQLLSYLIEWPDLMIKIAEKMILPFDKEKLFLNRSWKELTKAVGSEDKAASLGLRFKSTFDKLNDGDPQKQIEWSSPDNPVAQAYHLLQESFRSDLKQRRRQSGRS